MRRRFGGRAGVRVLAGVVLVSAVWAGGVARASAGGPGTPSNREFIVDAAERAVSKALDGLPLSSGDSVAVEGRQEDVARMFWEEMITEELARRGLLVHRAPAAAGGAGSASTPVSVTPGAQGAQRMAGARGGGAGGGQTQISGPSEPPQDLASFARDSAGKTVVADSGAAPAAASPSGTSPVPENGRPAVTPEPPFNGPYVRFSTQELGLAYTRAHGGGLFGHPVLDRHARASLLVELASGHDGAISWTGRGDASASDRVSASDLGELEMSPVPCAPPKWEGRSFLSRIAEPALVVSIVGGLVYLFYANRSS